MQNKNLGAYYTPKFISDFIVEEAVYLYLKQHCDFITYKNFAEFYEKDELNEKQLLSIDDLLSRITILDPAVGTGHFLISAAEILLNFRKLCNHLNEDVRLRSQIISNNIFGIDISEKAIAICKSRILKWSQIKESKEISKVVDCNLRKGDALIGFTYNNRNVSISLTERLKKFNSEVSEFQNYNSLDIFETYERPLIYQELKQELDNQFYENLDLEWSKIIPFHWILEYPQIMNEKNMGFDLVVGNPPYIRIEMLSPVIIDLYKSQFNTAHERSDIYIPFIERSYELINNTGIIGFLTSNQFMVAKYGKKIRSFISKNCGIYKIVDFTNFILFDKISVYTSIILFGKHKVDTVNCVSIRSQEVIDEIKNYGLHGLKNDNIRYFDLSSDDFSENEWYILSKYERKLKEKILSFSDCTLGEKDQVTICSPLTTGLDGVLLAKIIDDDGIYYRIKNKYNESIVEKKIWKKIFRPGKMSKWISNEVHYVVSFPYKINNGIYELISEDELLKEYPKTMKFLEPFKVNLLLRKDSRKNWIELGRPWYSLHRVGIPSNYDKNKIIINSVIKNTKFSIDKHGYLLPHGGVFGIISKSLDYYFLLAYLNSKVVYFYLNFISSKKRGGYISININTLSKIPILDFDLDKQLIKKIENRFDNIQAFNQFSLLGNVFDHEIFQILKPNYQETIITKHIIRSISKFLVNNKLKISRETVLLFENCIDNCIYKIFHLNNDEISIINETSV